jgi:hypothetical protein
MAVLVSTMIRGSVAAPARFALFLMVCAVAVVRASGVAGAVLVGELLSLSAAGDVSAARPPGRRLP